MSVDSYNLPEGILGLHPDAFYGAIGRIVCVSAVLEQQMTAMRHTLERIQQGQLSHQPVSEQIKTARKLSYDLETQQGDRVREFLDSAERAFTKRNEIVHSAFPAQADGRLWGHRPTRDRAVTDGTADQFSTTFDGLKEFIADLSELVRNFNQIFAICASPGAPA